MAQNGAATIAMNAPGRAVQRDRDLIDAAIARVLDSGWYVLGPENRALEADLATFVGKTHAVLVGNGTDALQLALAAAGIGSGDAVATVANAGGYSTAAIRANGAVPRYVDIDGDTMLMSLATVRAAVEEHGLPRAVIVTHLFGASAPVDEIVDWAQAHGVLVIEDVAQALGGMRGHRRLGAFADVSTISFYPTKNLAALGDGGAVLTDDPGIAERLRSLRQYGWDRKYIVAREGGRNSRMDELQAAIVRDRLPMLDALNARRRDIHDRYAAASGSLSVLVNDGAKEFVGHLAVLVTPDRDRAIGHFAARGVSTDIHYPVPDHLQFGSRTAGRLPVTEAAASTILSVPLYPELEDREIDQICSALRDLPS